MNSYYCPYFKRDVILTEERYNHIKRQHPDLIPEFEYSISETIADPDTIRKSARFQNALLFSKYFERIKGGKYSVIVIVSDVEPDKRDWIITAYITRKLSYGEIIWEKK